jgi:hypothetical protein
MPAPRCRPFTVLDAMIFVAATAVGLWIARGMGLVMDGMFGVREERFFGGWPSVEWPDPSDPLFRWGTYRGIHRALASVFFEAMPVMLPWTLALLWVRLRKPRPPLRRLCRQPGFAASTAVAIVTLIAFLGELSSSVERTTWGDGFKFRLGLMFISARDHYLRGEVDPPFGWAVVAVWGVLALGRMVRREPGWIDRMGQFAGFYWAITLILAVSRIQAD